MAADHSTQNRLIDAGSRPRLLERGRAVAAMLFVAALFIPLVGAGLHWDPVPSSENRAMAKLPPRPKTFKQFTRFSDLFLDYYRDHFGLRNALIRGLTLVKFHGGLAFGQGTSLVFGKDGWLFYPKEVHNFLADRNLDPFTSGDLDIWQGMLERRFKFCAEHGIRFIVVIPPDKQTVYPEFLRRIPFPAVGVSDTTMGTDARAPSLYMIHDSFARSLYQLLGPHFSRVRWEWTGAMNGPEVLGFKPDVVIDEFVERAMYEPAPVDTDDVRAVRPR